ncbi:MAG: PhzF family phenazine biosynthesis protein [Thermoplasmata archaeon]|nr:PhzF family phenazine biosynthesis protein [Thermoplasmata archaeon]
MKKARFVRVDVFADRPFGGNPLAVFPEADDLTSKEMQALAMEMNLSETTFVVPPTPGSGADFRVRIFVPDMEIQYAGHPTIGTFYVLAKEGRIKLKDPVTKVKMEVLAGVMPVEIHSTGGKITKVVTVQNKPEFGQVFDDPSMFVKALSLEAKDLDPSRMPVQLVSTGLPWAIVPVRTRKAVEKAAGNATAFVEVFKHIPKESGIYVTCLEPLERTSTTHSRGFSLVAGNVAEDPATGSASGCMGAYLVNRKLVKTDRVVRMTNEQGYEMGRASKIEIEVRTDGKKTIEEVRVGGTTVHMMDGVAYV